jgi:hypothetical protein
MMEAAHSVPMQEIPYEGPLCRLCGYPAPDKRKWPKLGRLGLWLFKTPRPPLCLVCWQFFANIVQIKDIVTDEAQRRLDMPQAAPMDKSVFTRSAQ